MFEFNNNKKRFFFIFLSMNTLCTYILKKAGCLEGHFSL